MKKVHKSLADKSSLEVAQMLSQAALEKKAEDLLILDVHGISSFADYFVLMSGRSTRHVQGLADTVGHVAEPGSRLPSLRPYHNGTPAD